MVFMAAPFVAASLLRLLGVAVLSGNGCFTPAVSWSPHALACNQDHIALVSTGDRIGDGHGAVDLHTAMLTMGHTQQDLGNDGLGFSLRGCRW